MVVASVLGHFWLGVKFPSMKLEAELSCQSWPFTWTPTAHSFKRLNLPPLLVCLWESFTTSKLPGFPPFLSSHLIQWNFSTAWCGSSHRLSLLSASSSSFCWPFVRFTCLQLSLFHLIQSVFMQTGKEDGKSCQKVTVRMTIRKNDCRSNRPVRWSSVMRCARVFYTQITRILTLTGS